jgi:hypothetical protein
MGTRKPLSELSPAYQARIERGEARGLSRAEARGHATKQTQSVTASNYQPFTRKEPGALSSAYAKRITSAEARGLSRSQARGHAGKSQLSATEIKLSNKKGNSLFLLKRVKELNDPNFTREYHKMMKEKDPKKRDAIARNLADNLVHHETGRDLYSTSNYIIPEEDEYTETENEYHDENQ